MTVRMRHTRSHTANRRSHHALKEPRLSICEKCGEKKLRHRVCETCGTYRSRQVIDVASRTARNEARLKAKQKAMGLPTRGKGSEAQEEKGADETPRNPETLLEKKKV